MGLTDVDMVISNPKNSTKKTKVNMLVDSGATFSFINKGTLEALGVEPLSKQEFFLANGKRITRDVGGVVYQFKDKHAFAPVVFAEKGDVNLLGVLTLEAMGMMLDPVRRQLLDAKLRM